MKFIPNSVRSYLEGWRKTVIGGVPLLVMRDDVERSTSYRHPTDPYWAADVGVYPLIIHDDGQLPRICCSFQTGDILGYAGFRQLIVNVDGRVMKWEGQLTTYRHDGFET